MAGLDVRKARQMLDEAERQRQRQEARQRDLNQLWERYGKNPPHQQWRFVQEQAALDDMRWRLQALQPDFFFELGRPARGFIPATLPTDMTKTLVVALASELDDMRARGGFTDYRRGPERGETPGLDVLEEAGLTGRREESPLYRRYILAVRWWRLAQGVYGDHMVRLIDSAADGALFTIPEWEGEVPNRALMVSCPSMDKSHVLFVPTTMRSAREARAWTFGMTPEEFDLGCET